MRNTTDGALTYLRVIPTAGSVSNTAILNSNWGIYQNDLGKWQAGSSHGIYKADANGTMTFQLNWQVGSGTGYYQYCSIVAYVLGR